MIRQDILRLACITLGITCAAPTIAKAADVTWDIDPNQSFVRLIVPDQSGNFDGTTATIRLRDSGDNSNWTDNGGRRAFVDGTIQTNYIDGASIQFLSGSHNIFALEQTNLRPNPAAFNPGNTNADNPDGQYSNTSTAAAAYGARVRATATIVITVTVDVAYLAIRDVEYNLGSGVIPLGGGTMIGGSTSTFGISSASIDVDGLNTIAGQFIPDVRDGALPAISGTNTASGTITNLGGLQRRLNYNILENISINLEGTILNGTAEGQIVAFATVPEPSTVILGAMGFLGLLGWQIRRRRAA